MPIGRGTRIGWNGGSRTNITGYRLRRAVRRADLPAVAETRRVLRDNLREWGVAALVDTTELLATELLTNALQHTCGGAVLTATLSPEGFRAGEPGQRLRIEVRDTVARLPRPRPQRWEPDPAGDYGTSGRGLLLVDALADDWGVRPCAAGGKEVWFELNAEALNGEALNGEALNSEALNGEALNGEALNALDAETA
ncbi:ATP-binding protein [Streptomyces sp. NBC_00669]|uniref:ATP-binding protein n=1 Tax=Streptomyces sp. NBC_00669 TaxID=2976011 RepID=UPI002E34CE91|nr:ATP-binding protein [Streptomyces sp. NBC_00669]